MQRGFDHNTQQKSPAKRFLFILGLALFLFYLALGIYIIFWKDIPFEMSPALRIGFGVLLIIYAFLGLFACSGRAPMNFRNTFFVAYLFALGLVYSCNGKREQTPTQGEVQIIVDESLEPIIKDQQKVFNTSYPNGKIDMVYKPEVNAFNIFLSDSIKVAVLTRTLTEDEMKHFKNRGIVVRTNRFAVDGIALINSTASSDTSVMVSDVVNQLTGRPGRISQLVFDNANSSTFRYLKELAKIENLPTEGVYALKSNREVIRYVADHPQAIGVVGMNWMEQPDVKLEPVVAKVKYMSVKDENAAAGKQGYFLPSQESLALEQYPLRRNLYIINCSGGHGLGTGFASFITSERGSATGPAFRSFARQITNTAVCY